MKPVLVLLFVNTAFVGCHNVAAVQHTNPQVVSPEKTEHQKSNRDTQVKSEAIVVFEKGTTIQTAKEIIDAYGMRVLKVYERISASSHKPMLHVSSSLSAEKMIQLLHKDPKISSVSPNYVRQLKDK